MRDYLLHQDIQIDDDEFENIYDEIILRESHIQLSSNISYAINKDPENHLLKVNKKKKQQKKELNVSDKFAKGFVKALGGALLCIIPHPVTWGVGAGLVVSGVNDMINNADTEQNPDSLEDKMKSLPPPPEKMSQQFSLITSLPFHRK